MMDQQLYITKTDNDSILSNTSYALLLGSETTIRLKFTTSDPDAAVTVTYRNEAVDADRIEHTVDSSGNHVLKIKNINAAQLAEMYSVEVGAQGNSASINVSALSYACTILRYRNIAYASHDYNNDGSIAYKAAVSLYHFYRAALDYALYLQSISGN